MSFTTPNFLIFFVIVFIGYYIVPRRFQWIWLLVASYVFYALASPLYIVFLLISTFVTYGGARLIDNINVEQNAYVAARKHEMSKNELNSYKEVCNKRKKTILTFVIILAVGLLAILKYSSFLLQNVSVLVGILGVKYTSPALSLILPIGLSFYTFQSLGYCIDVFRGNSSAEKNPVKYALFISYFPQILQGPIGIYEELAPQLYKQKEFNYSVAVTGAQRAAWGFFKKLVIANQLSVIVDTVLNGYSGYYGLSIVFALFLYSIQLYADFSGYVDIALGCSQMLNIKLSENFDTPYFSKNIAEFWRRWHISLGVWFKNYVFYPILRSRRVDGIRKHYKEKKNSYLSNTLPTVIALAIVWLLIGIWHGANWCYVLYGIYYGTFIILSTIMSPFYAWFDKKYSSLKGSKIFRAFQIVRTFLIVSFGYILFRPANLAITNVLMHNMFEKLNVRSLFLLCYTNIRECIICGFGIITLIIVDVYHLKQSNYSLRTKINSYPKGIRWAIYIIGVLSILVMGAYGSEVANEFAYFRF